MKKIILAITVFLLVLPISFSLSKEKIDYEKLFTEVSENYGVKKIEMPDSRSEYYTEKYIQFEEINSGKETKKRTTFSQKNKNYIIEFFDISTVFFQINKGKFKIIDEDNQIIQVCEFDAIPNPYYGFFDCNMDGYQDLLIMDKNDKFGTSYFVYYWSNMKKQFEKDDHSFINFALDKKHDFIYERFTDQTKELVYRFYEYRFGIRRFVAEVRFTFTDYSKGIGFKIVYSTEEGKTEGDKDVFVFQFPVYNEFLKLSEEEQSVLKKQYEKLAKKVNAL